MKGLVVEVNAAQVEPNPPRTNPAGHMLLITPPISEDFWWAPVQLGQGQAVVCFPKFLTIGIGFQQEKDWNTNLPYTSSAEEIYEHIKHNKGPCEASRETCIAAIELLQQWASARQARED